MGLEQSLTSPGDVNKPVESGNDGQEGVVAAPDNFKVLLSEFVNLEKRRRDVDGELESIKARTTEIEPKLLEQMAELGLQNARVDGLTVFQRTDRYVTKRSEKDGVTTERLIEALRGCGLDYMVAENYSSASLKSKIVEWIVEGIEVPPELAACLNIGETLRLVTRK